MTFGEYKEKHAKQSTVGYWTHSITIPDEAEAIPAPPGADVDGDTVDGKFVCYAHGNWWAWPTNGVKQ